jgi:hypothetical protein
VPLPKLQRTATGCHPAARRPAFALAVSHGLRPDIAGFRIAHHISATAWPTALVLMAICEVTTRIAIVQLRGRRAMVGQAAGTTAIPAAG